MQDKNFEIFKEIANKEIRQNNYKLIADKIITNHNINKNIRITASKRWAIELFQNAVDVRFPNEKSSIKIILSDDKLEFLHNGKYFEIKNLLGLMQQSKF